MNPINVSLEAVSPPPNLPHASRAEEIRSLPQWLRVKLSSIGSLSLVHIGETQPSGEFAGMPWVKTKGDGTPDDFLISTPQGYQSAISGSLRGAPAMESKLRVLTGTADLDLTGKTIPGGADSPILHVDFTYATDEGGNVQTDLGFDTFFVSAPQVFLSLEQAAAPEDGKFLGVAVVQDTFQPGVAQVVVKSVERDGFRVGVTICNAAYTPVATVLAGKFKVRWMAMGPWEDGEE